MINKKNACLFVSQMEVVIQTHTHPHSHVEPGRWKNMQVVIHIIYKKNTEKTPSSKSKSSKFARCAVFADTFRNDVGH